MEVGPGCYNLDQFAWLSLGKAYGRADLFCDSNRDGHLDSCERGSFDRDEVGAVTFGVDGVEQE